MLLHLDEYNNLEIVMHQVILLWRDVKTLSLEFCMVPSFIVVSMGQYN